MLDANRKKSDVSWGVLESASVCPICAGQLHWECDGIECLNPECRRRFRVLQGVPVLADEEACPISFEPDRASDNKSTAKSLALRWLPSLDLNVVPERVKVRLHEEVFARSARPVVLNIGGKHPTSITDQLCTHPDIQAIECDLAYRPRTRLLADPSRIPLADASVDAVLLDALLEHVPDPDAVTREALRVLKPGGVFYADTPFMIQVHGGAFDYSRMSLQAQRWMFRDLEELESGVSSGPSVALGYSIQYFMLCFVSSRPSRYAVKAFTRLIFFWLKYFDLLLSQQPAARDAAAGFYFLGRKSKTRLTAHDTIALYDGAVPDLYPHRPPVVD